LPSRPISKSKSTARGFLRSSPQSSPGTILGRKSYRQQEAARWFTVHLKKNQAADAAKISAVAAAQPV
jgi:hypothetical protein